MPQPQYWVKIDSWHLIDVTFTTDAGWRVVTKCGLERNWDHTFLDRLPGGSEKSCENCLVDHVLEEAPPAPKRTRKKVS